MIPSPDRPPAHTHARTTSPWPCMQVNGTLTFEKEDEEEGKKEEDENKIR